MSGFLDQPANSLRLAMEDGSPAHECQCQEHDCTNRVRCSELEPCDGDHRCSQCDDGSYVCAVSE